MSTKYHLIHDESYAEERSDNQYVVVKVYDDSEVGQIKLELVDDPSHDGPTVKVRVAGNISGIKLVNPEMLAQN